MSERQRLILGTAGHIDHGKTTLVRALTGVDCDRLPEERERGITIELGFAPFELPSGRRLGIVDVPGHEKLVRTMVAGASGVDLVLLVVAAEEGMMPQTREHLAICELLGVRRGVIALTKTDAVDPELVELAREDVELELSTSPLAGRPIVPVSARSGEGIDALRQALETEAAESQALTLRDGPSWLPIDRVFSMKGFGTVVTGTLRGATLRVEDTLDVWADDRSDVQTARVRGIQTHGSVVDAAEPGSRCAVNLHGLDASCLPRGSILASPGRAEPRRRFDVKLQLVPQAPTLRSGSSFTIHLGTTERQARVRLLGREALVPEETAFAEIRLDRPVPLLDAERFILRGFTRLADAGWTIGGGEVLDAAPSRRRQNLEERIADLDEMASGDPQRALAARLRRAGAVGVSRAELAASVRSLEQLAGIQVGGRWLHDATFESLVRQSVDAVKATLKANPDLSAADLNAVQQHGELRAPDDVTRKALETARARKLLQGAGQQFRIPGHSARAADPALAGKARDALKTAGLGPEAVETLAAGLNVDAAALRSTLDFLVREGHVKRVASGLYFDSGVIDDLESRLVTYLEANESIDPAGYKELTGQSRKFTVPLMEYFDTQRITVRRGNTRVLR